MTREENLLYRRSCPYDAMGDYSLLIEKQQMKSTESEAHPFPAKSKKGTDSAVPIIKLIRLSAGSKRSFRLPLKKTACRESFLLPFLWIFCALASGRPEPTGGKVVAMLTLQDLKWIVKKPETEKKSSHGKAFAGTGRANRKYGKWRRGTAFGIPGRICDLSDRKICHGLSGT